MKKQIRRGVFKTNSSSTHSLTMMTKGDYDRWGRENLYLFNGSTYGWDFNKPVKNNLYTREEAIKFVKNHRHYDSYDEIDSDEIDEECLDNCLAEYDFISWNYEGSEYLESFYEEFTTPSGETIVAFGEYGYDG